MEIATTAFSVKSGGFQPIDRELTCQRRILVHDGEDETRFVLSKCLNDEGIEIVYSRSLDETASLLARSRSGIQPDGSSERPFDLMLWGLMVPFEDGLESLKAMRMAHPGMRVVLLAPQEALAFAPAIKSIHAEALILKPLHTNDLRTAIERALKRPAIADMTRGTVTPLALMSRGPISPDIELQDGRDLGLIGTSPEMRKVFALIRKVGPANVNVLVTGESGTGKEMVASAIHRCSDRAGKPFIAINCAAIPRELLESELFGHAKGAFTGATMARRGLFEEADGGTILLDEIGDLPLPLQAKILRLLQTRQVKPLGQNVTKEVDVRIISATHKNLKSLIQKGEFREDLFYRLNVMPIHLPALRDRKDDIVHLAEHFLRRYGARSRRQSPELTRKAIAKLQSMMWKGNVRELENVFERAIVLSDGITINDTDILGEEAEPVRLTSEDLFNAGMSLKDIEREYIKYVLNRTGNRKEAATRILGIDRKTLYRKEKLYGIRPSGELN